METFLFDFLKKNIVTVISFLVIGVIVLLLGVRVYSLNNKNNVLKLTIEQKEKDIERLNIDISKYVSLINEMNRQKDIENNLIEKNHVIEKELMCKKENAQEQIQVLEENDEDVKSWCEEQIPSQLSTIFIIGK